MKLTELMTAKKISIAGHGVEGKAAEQFCKNQCSAASLNIVESITSPVQDDGSVWIVSPGIPRTYLVNVPTERVTAGTEIFFDSLTEGERARVIGISGTKGKSTTTKFCTEAFVAAGKKAVAAGNYGTPLLEVFEDFQAGNIDYVVAELSSYQLETLQTSPGIAIFLNLFPDHLDRHETIENYREAKSNLWKHQKAGDTLLIPENLETQFDTAANINKAALFNKELFPQDSAFRADHWCQNLGTVQELFQVLKLSEEAISQTAKQFEGLPHRLQKFSTAKDRTWWDDAICTNPEAAIATVKFFGSSLGAILLGGQDRGMDYSGLATALQQEAPQAVVIIPDSEIAARLEPVFSRAVRVADFDEAVVQILENTPEGTNAVLCPAAPSYDAFKNFQEKGDAFQKAVRRCD